MKAGEPSDPRKPPEADAAGFFRAVFERAPVGVAQIETATGRFVRVNQRFGDILGYSRQEMERLDFQSLTHPDDATVNVEPMRRLVAGEIREFIIEKRCRHKEGRMVWVSMSVSPLWATGEAPNYHIAVVEDVTERRRMEKALEETSQELDRFFNVVLDLLCIADIHGRFLRLNPHWEKTLGYSLTELEGRRFLDFVHPDDLEGTLGAMQELAQQKTVLNFTNRYRCRDGSYRWIEWRSFPAGERIYAAARDITERIQTEQALNESRERLHSIIRAAPTGIGLVVNRMLTEVNTRICEMTGYRAEELLGASSRVLYPTEEDFQYVGQEKYRQIAEHGTGTVETRWRRKDGAVIDVLLSSTPIDPSNLSRGVTFTALDITDRKQAEAATRESERKYRGIFENVQDVFFEATVDGLILDVSPSIEHVSKGEYHRDDLIGGSLFNFYANREEWDAYLETLKKRGSVTDYEIGFRNRDGSIVTCSVSSKLQRDSHGGPVRIIGSLRDIAERKRSEEEKERLQAQLLQAQKVESVGRLAGGVAHDFNNMLQAILGNAALALEETEPGSVLREYLEEIQKSALRSADLTRQLLAFARKQTIQPRVLDLNDTVAGMLKMLRRLIGEDIDLAWRPGTGLWPVKVDPGQIDQILANLCVNARDAISGTGHVTIETANATLDDTYTHAHPDCAAGDYVMLAVSDTGHGMNKETRAHLFEPFFTTKEMGKGTGLGLATVFGIVKQNRGLISVYSEPAQGTTFKIYLPRSETDAVAEAPKIVRRSLRGAETVLLVEDEEQILNLGRRILAQQGYTVLVASAPAEALVVAERHAGPIHLLITDVVMPGMNGKQLHEQLRNRHPELKCLFMSGYTANVIAHHGVLDDGVQFLQKPFTIQSLAEKTRDALEPSKVS